MPDAFATAGDLDGVWRPLTPAEAERAETLLFAASARLRARWPDIDARIANGTVDPYLVVDIVVQAVKRQFIGGDAAGITQQSQGAGPFNQSVSYANPLAGLYWTNEDIALLDNKYTRVRAKTVWLS